VRVLLDESIPHDLSRELLGHDVRTVSEYEWAGLPNGELLRRARGEFEAFLTMDQGIPYQQNLSAVGMRVVLIHSRSNRMADLRPLIPAILEVLDSIKPGELRRVGA
jgi:hypothetical protein